MRYVRTVLAILIGLSLISLGLVASLYFIITPESVQTRISNTLSSHFGVTIEPTSEFKLQRLPQLTITIPKSDIRFIASTTASGTIESAVITMNPFAYFAKKPRIEDISLAGLSLKMQSEDVKTLMKPRPVSTSEIISIQTLSARSTSILFSQEGNSLCRIENAQIAMRDITENGAGLASKFLFQTNDFSGNTELSAILDWHEGPVSAVAKQINLATHGLWKDTDVTSEVSIATLSNPFVHAYHIEDLSGKIQLANGYALRFMAPTFTKNGDRLSAKNARTSLMIPSAKGSDIFVIDGNLGYQAPEQALTASDLKIETSSLPDESNVPIVNGSVTGDLHWNFALGEGRILLDGIFRNTPLKIDTVVHHPVNTPLQMDKVTLPDVNDVTTQLNENTETIDTSVGVEEESMSSTKLTRPLVTGEITIGRLSADRLARLFSSQSTWLSSFDWQLNFAIGMENAVLGIHRLEGVFLTSKDGAHVENGTASMTEVTVPFTAMISPNGQWEADVDWHDIDSETFFAQPVLKGISRGDLHAQGNISDLSKTTAELNMDVRDGEIAGADLTKANEVMVRERPEQLPREAFAAELHTPFEFLSLKAKLSDSVWTLDQTSINGPLWKAQIAGQSYARIFTLKSDIYFLKENGELAFSMPTVITIRPNETPVWNPNWTKARESANTTLGEVAWSFNLLKDKAKREFDNWWDSQDWSKFDVNPSEWLPEWEWPDLTYPDWVPKWIPRPEPEKKESSLPI